MTLTLDNLLINDPVPGLDDEYLVHVGEHELREQIDRTWENILYHIHIRKDKH